MITHHASQPGPLYRRVVRLVVVLAGINRGAAVSLLTFGAGPRPPVGGHRKGHAPLALPPA